MSITRICSRLTPLTVKKKGEEIEQIQARGDKNRDAGRGEVPRAAAARPREIF